MRPAAILLPTLWLVLGLPAPKAGPRFDRIYDLKKSEGVFAYARISPDGKSLAYASEMTDPLRHRMTRSVTVVDLPARAVKFVEEGIDAYWSTDGERMIFSGIGGVTIRHLDGRLIRAVAPGALGDYYSWGKRDGKNLILTIASNYYYLDGDRAVLPAGRVFSCPGIGTGSRPLLSKDGKQITTFVRGTVVVRDLTDCDKVLDTGLEGAKADFSWDGRYIAFHVAKPALATGYEINVVDVKERTVRRLTTLPGSSFFPSWTQDGRLCFRYDGDEYKGFMMASNVLDVPAQPLPKANPVPTRLGWQEIFPETPAPRGRWAVVMVWAPWSAHMPESLIDLQRAGSHFATQGLGVSVMTATDPVSHEEDIQRILHGTAVTLRRIPLAAGRLRLTEAQNQIPTNLLFHDGQLVERHLGPLSYDGMLAWVATAQATDRSRE